MADDPREGPKAIINRFLQHKGMEQIQDYLARGRRFAHNQPLHWRDVVLTR